MATILTIDDSSLAHHMVRLALEGAGHRLVWARDGAEGVERAREGVDVVILGVSLPVGRGVEVLGALRAAGIGAAAVVVGTGMSEATRAACAELGAVSFVERPIMAGSVRAGVERALGAGTSRSAA